MASLKSRIPTANSRSSTTKQLRAECIFQTSRGSCLRSITSVLASTSVTSQRRMARQCLKKVSMLHDGWKAFLCYFGIAVTLF
ncbi:hypothetical protein OWV82_020306 [Melia azedarach]|uniref:Uncharacterized protein n=1 Tax=Melia azedarach TaxID=155640 RepID=A0ACC1X5I3_MELAZ|nr:hypothetical protein OWV82_020306 [Melia azedarach]